jgi:hypothetical protein
MVTGMVHANASMVDSRNGGQHNQYYPIFITIGNPTTVTPTPTTPVVTVTVTPTPIVQASCSKVSTSKTQLEIKTSGDTVNVNGEATVTVNRGTSVIGYRVTRMDFTIAKPSADDFISIIPWTSVSNPAQVGPAVIGGNDVYTYRPANDTTLSVPYAQLVGARTSGGLKVLLRVQTADGNWVSEDVATCQSLSPALH